MKISVPREVKNHEYRVALTPAGAHEFVRHGHEVFVEKDAGAGSSIPDADFQSVAFKGAASCPSTDATCFAGMASARHSGYAGADNERQHDRQESASRRVHKGGPGLH